jgi:hypothetical protein
MIYLTQSQRKSKVVQQSANSCVSDVSDYVRIYSEYNREFEHRNILRNYDEHFIVKGKVIPLQALTGPEGTGRLRLSYFFKTIGT